MSGSSSKSGSKSNNAYNFGQSIPGFQQTALQNLYGAAQNLFGQTSGQINSANSTATNAANKALDFSLPALQTASNGGQFGDPVFKQQLVDSLNNSLNRPTNTQQVYANVMGGNGNNYADALKSSFIGDANRATDNMLANLDARAAATGMSGGSRHGIATSRGLYDINSNLQKNLAQVGYDTFNQDLNNKLNIAQQADTNTLNRQQMLSSMLGSAQDTSNNAVTNMAPAVQNLGMGTFAPFMAPWDALNNYAAAIGSPTVLTSGNGKGSGKSLGMSGSGGVK